jgi:hypothetical protein
MGSFSSTKFLRFFSPKSYSFVEVQRQKIYVPDGGESLILALSQTECRANERLIKYLRIIVCCPKFII